MTDKNVTQTVVSPDATNGTEPVVTVGGKTVILVPWEEWKQSLQRGVRSFIQAATFLLGGGSISVFAASFGIAPDIVAELPTTGSKLLDALAVSFVFALLCFLWNMIEFALDIDIKAPRWRS